MRRAWSVLALATISAAFSACGSGDSGGTEGTDASQIAGLYEAREAAARDGNVEKACNWRTTPSGRKFEEETYKRLVGSNDLPEGFGGATCKENVKAAEIVYAVVDGYRSITDLCEVPGFSQQLEREFADQGTGAGSCADSLAVIDKIPGAREQLTGQVKKQLNTKLVKIDVQGDKATAEVSPNQANLPTQYFVKEGGQWLVTGP